MPGIEDRLTTSWAQRIVDRHAQNVVVSGIKINSVEVGTTTRVRVTVDHNGPQTLPRRWFIKAPSKLWRVRMITALPRLLQTEARFYQELVNSVPVTCPTILSTQQQWGQGTTVVLADVTEVGATAGSPCDALTGTQAAAVVERLARLHARFWHKVGLESADDWLAGSMRRLEDRLGSALAVPLMRRGLSLAGSVVPAELHPSAKTYAGNRRQAMKFLETGPLTLVHHDLHPGNFFWRESQPGFLDWQLVRIGEGIGDVAYFLATALTPETRRENELDLLTRYQQVLAGEGVAAPDVASLLKRYRVHLAYPFEAMVVTLAVGGMMDRGTNLELIRRATAAVMDHDTYSGFDWK